MSLKKPDLQSKFQNNQGDTEKVSQKQKPKTTKQTEKEKKKERKTNLLTIVK